MQADQRLCQAFIIPSQAAKVRRLDIRALYDQRWGHNTKPFVASESFTTSRCQWWAAASRAACAPVYPCSTNASATASPVTFLHLFRQDTTLAPVLLVSRRDVQGQQMPHGIDGHM